MPSLTLIVENWPRQRYPLDEPPILIGNSKEAHIQLPSPEISARHASISRENSQYVLRTEASSTPVRLNGQIISQSILKHQDILRFQDYLFLVDLEDPKTTSAHIRKPNSKSLLRLFNIFLLILAFPMTALVTFSLTLYGLPLATRDSLVESKRLEKFPPILNSFFTTLLTHDKPSHEENVVLQANHPIRTTIAVPRPIRLLGKLRLPHKSASAFQLKIQLFEQNRKGEKQTVFVNETVEVPSGTQTCALFSIALEPATYGFEGFYQSESSGPESPAHLLFYIE